MFMVETSCKARGEVFIDWRLRLGAGRLAYGQCRTRYRRGNSGADHQRRLRLQQQPQPKMLENATVTAIPRYSILQDANSITARNVL